MAELADKYDFVFFFDVQDGNPNGDPDAGNLPRLDPETGHGIVTDVCLKRKLRNFVQLAKAGQPGYEIFVKERAILNNLIEEAHEQPKVKTKKGAERTDAARDYMCARFFDVRAFGAVMSTGKKEEGERTRKNAGQVRGPVQLTFSRSQDPILPLEHSITRVAVATPEEAAKQEGETRMMGRKATVPYGLYRCHGFVSAALARQTGFTSEDLDLLWDAFDKMFYEDRSAARGLMSKRGLKIFKHESLLGNAPAQDLFGRVRAKLKDPNRPPRAFEDYEIVVSREDMPRGVTLIEK
jgi:CRISPR-associated protein Csd2